MWDVFRQAKLVSGGVPIQGHFFARLHVAFLKLEQSASNSLFLGGYMHSETDCSKH